MITKPDLIRPTPAEDATIARGIAEDRDAVSVPTEQFKEMRSAREVLGKDKADALAKRRGRPAKPASERKVNQTLRIDPDVLAAYKATGSGWQTLMNEALRDYAAARRMLLPRR
ncbi:BrnA antitoxin family protein [Cupriavidus sp. MP-37]|uniref:BrnA antitoxin family protein n=1 Tax=Cupriavidus sp. MP-37 TaxID=2884455 RepID=UPI001D0BB3CB|nr:BrnA antitoxin family protein [Cupriavidus sp. MP-37]UDM53445.1 BrnA antitoxin family protein [Cupriavidus sp. MP-37]